MKNKKRLALSRVEGFTLVELIVVVAIMAILSGIILYSVTVYISKSKDTNIVGNLAVLIPDGEAYYNSNNNDGYLNFCISGAVKNAESNMPRQEGGILHCNSNKDLWAACFQEFSDTTKAYCVDSTGASEQILNCNCSDAITSCVKSLSCGQ